MELQITRSKNESNIEYIYRVCSMKGSQGLTWSQIRDIINNELGLEYSESYYRKGYKNNSFPTIDVDDNIDYASVEDDKINELRDTLFELKKERIKNSDERTQIMAATRRIAREETLLEIATEVAKSLKNKPVMLTPFACADSTGTGDAILQISDWHYGIEVNNPWNIYNPCVAKARLSKLLVKVKDLIIKHGVRDLYIANLGDLISGRIHETIRIQNRVDVITRSLEVAECLVEFIANLSQVANIHYLSTSDNHSRMEPKKEASLDLESLTRLIDPLIESRIQLLQANKQCGSVEFIKTPYGPDIVTFKVAGWKVGAVHGHKDNPKSVVNNISLMTRDNYDLILTAHLHHFSCSEEYNCVVVSNGSLMGVDDYAENLRVMSKPTQNLIILSADSPADSIHRIVLD